MELHEMADRIMLNPTHPPMDVWVLLPNAVAFGKLRSLVETLSFLRESMVMGTANFALPALQKNGSSTPKDSGKQEIPVGDDGDKFVMLTEVMIRFGDIQVDAPVAHVPSQHVLCWGPGTPIIVSTNA